MRTKRNLISLTLILTMLLLLVAFNNCGKTTAGSARGSSGSLPGGGGSNPSNGAPQNQFPGDQATSTGNPGSGYSDAEAALPMLYVMCTKVASCRPNSNFDDCANALFNSAEMVTQIGFPDNYFYPHFSNVLYAVDNFSLKVSEANLSSCAVSIASLPCDSPLVASSFAADQVHPYANAYKLVQMGYGCQAMVSP